MKRSTLTLLLLASSFYLLLLFLFRNAIPESVTPTLPLLALPLLSIALILTWDLHSRSTSPIKLKVQESAGRLRARDVQSLTRQVEVSGRASPAYFDTILRSRLREVLIQRVCLETGLERDSVKKTLGDRILGAQLLMDQRMYELLFYPPPSGSGSRIQMLREIIERIEAWKA